MVWRRTKRMKTCRVSPICSAMILMSRTERGCRLEARERTQTLAASKRFQPCRMAQRLMSMTKFFGSRAIAVSFALALLFLLLPALAQAQDAAPVEAAQDASGQNNQGDLIRQLKLTDEQ